MSALHIPTSYPETLISGGGDPEIRVWDWKSGTLKQEIPILDAVQEYIAVKVKSSARKRQWGNEEDIEGGNTGAHARRKGKGKKGKGQNVEAEQTPEVEVEDDLPAEEIQPASDEKDVDITVLVVHKIQSLARGSDTLIVFSVVG